MDKQTAKKPGQEIAVAIIGSGFSGICMGIKLKQAGIHSFVILEKEGDIGGTWRENHYPGAACDVPSHLYSYSFEPSPRWGRNYAPQKEILEYLKFCARKYGLYSHFQFNTKVTGAEFDRTSGTWTVSSEKGPVCRARSIAMGIGGLHIPKLPEIPGIGAFEGKQFHSTRWDHDYDLEGKTVAVIGTGASAIQFVPQIAPKVKQLHLFQRTPPWIFPKALDREIGRGEQLLYRFVPALQRLQRNAMFWGGEAGAVAMVYRPELMRGAEVLAKSYIRRAIKDPRLRKAVTPTYRAGCKRMLVSSDYYPALTRPNVEVVTDGIASVTREGLRTQDGRERQVDAIIYGTGFDVVGSIGSIDIRGIEGLSVRELMEERPEHFLGINISGFPNFHVLMGPNTGLGQNSMVFMIESQARYAQQCIEKVEKDKIAWLDVKREVQSGFSSNVQQRLEGTVWNSGCQSWYRNDDGSNVTLWPGFCTEYWLRTRKPDLKNYHIQEKPESGFSMLRGEAAKA